MLIVHALHVRAWTRAPGAFAGATVRTVFVSVHRPREGQQRQAKKMGTNWGRREALHLSQQVFYIASLSLDDR